MRRTSHAPTTQRSAPLAEPFGRDLAARWFGQEALDSLPTRSTGKNAGTPKGYVCWLTTTAAGYHPNAGRAVGPNTTVRAWIGAGPMSPEGDALRGMWMGRIQTLCGSKDVLTAAYREQDAAERARTLAEFEAALAAREAKETHNPEEHPA